MSTETTELKFVRLEHNIFLEGEKVAAIHEDGTLRMAKGQSAVKPDLMLWLASQGELPTQAAPTEEPEAEEEDATEPEPAAPAPAPNAPVTAPTRPGANKVAPLSGRGKATDGTALAPPPTAL